MALGNEPSGGPETANARDTRGFAVLWFETS
jgi:hypothetical protein